MFFTVKILSKNTNLAYQTYLAMIRISHQAKHRRELAVVFDAAPALQKTRLPSYGINTVRSYDNIIA